MAKAATKRAPVVVARPPGLLLPAAREVFPHGTEEGQVEQGSNDWFRLRNGIPTASTFATVCAGGEGKTRTKLLYDLAGERLTGEPAENYSGAAMERGKVMETEARDWYSFTRNIDVERIGFVRNKLANGIVIGCSPDGFVTKRKGLEIKTQLPRLMIEQLFRAGLPPEHRAQVQGTMLVAELEEMDLLIFYRGMPGGLVFTVQRDDVYLKQLASDLERFDYELRELVEKVKRMLGAPSKPIDVAKEAIPR